MKIETNFSCDIFCAVVDNFGDIGVCWRLAKQLAHEHGLAVRLWIDDLASFKKLCAEIKIDRPAQQQQGIDVRLWLHTANAFTHIQPAQIVIETFACQLPEKYIAAMAAMPHPPVWINLEHLSAEDWVEEYHGLPSPHPTLPLVKYFFFPGFTAATGGLLLENKLLVQRDVFQRDAFQNNPLAQAAMWGTLGVPPPQPNEIRVSLFCYENAALPSLFSHWATGEKAIFCVIPEGRIVPQVATFFKHDALKIGDTLQQGNLRVQIIPFIEQDRYDELLWACDVNFVRGEDSFVRALWAGRPCVWHIYPQHDQVHLQKLQAFLNLYCATLPAEMAASTQALWNAWNNEQNVSAAWDNYWTHHLLLQQHARTWSANLAGNRLTVNLLNFIHNPARMRASRSYSSSQ